MSSSGETCTNVSLYLCCSAHVPQVPLSLVLEQADAPWGSCVLSGEFFPGMGPLLPHVWSTSIH